MRQEARPPVWSQPLDAPFVDIFRVLPGRGLLVGAMGWVEAEARFDPRELLLVDLADGRALWKAKRRAYDDGFYFYAGSNADVVVLQNNGAEGVRWVAYALADGREVFRFDVKGVASSVQVSGRLYIATKNHLWRLNLADGHVDWERVIAERAADAVLEVRVDDDAVCAVGAKVHCLEPETGAVLWEQNLADTGAVGALLRTPGLLVVATDSGVSAFERRTGKIVWRRPAPATGVVALQAVGDGLLITWLADSKNGVFEMAAMADGKSRWKTTMPLPRSRALLSSAGDTLLWTSSFLLHAVSVSTGKTVTRVWLPDELITTKRGADSLFAEEGLVRLTTELGLAWFDASTLLLKEIDRPNFVTTWSDAKSVEDFQDWLGALASPVSNKPAGRGSGALDTSSPEVAAAKARIALAYAQTREVTSSPDASPGQRIAASQSRQLVIGTSISSARTSIAMGQMNAALNLSTAALDAVASIGEALRIERARRSDTKNVLTRYFVTAAQLRLEGTPADYYVGANWQDLYVYGPGLSSIADVPHSDEGQSGWQHVAAIDVANGRVVGAHVPRGRDTRKERLNGEVERWDLAIESYALAGAAQVPRVPSNASEMTQRARSGELKSLRAEAGGDACYWSVAKFPVTRMLYDARRAALQGGNLTLLREMTAAGAQANEPPVEDIAAAAGNEDVLRYIVARKKDELAFSRAVTAIAFGDLKTLREALDAGLNPNGTGVEKNATRSCGLSLLATFSNQPKANDARALLLERGANVNLIDYEGKTPLDVLMEAKDQAGVSFLRAHGGRTAAELGGGVR